MAVQQADVCIYSCSNNPVTCITGCSAADMKQLPVCLELLLTLHRTMRMVLLLSYRIKLCIKC